MDAEHMQEDTSKVVQYVVRRGFTRVTLQFPDDQLRDAPLVAEALSRELAAVSDAKVYILADTTYNPLGVDEVAAEHVNAECVIHYGHASLSPVSRTPALCVLPRQPIDVQQCASAVADLLGDARSSTGSSSSDELPLQAVVLLHDQAYQHAMPAFQEALTQAYQGPLQLVFAQLSSLELDPPAQPNSSSSGDSRPGTSSRPATATACGSCSCNTPPDEQGHVAAQTTAGVPGTPAATGMQAAAHAPQPSTTQSATAGPAGMLPLHVEAAGAERPSEQQPDRTTTNSSTSTSGRSNTACALQAIGGLSWHLPPGVTAQQGLMLWLGPADSPVLTALQMTHSQQQWLGYDPSTQEVLRGVLPETARLLKRRYFLVEKARAASIIGILVGTLGTAGYKEALSKIRALARSAGKHTYTLLVGKPSPAKLANFPEVEVFVMVADPLGLILDSREYLAPVVTPHEALLAFSGEERHLDPGHYRLDFGELLAAQPTGTAREGGAGNGEASSSALALPLGLQLAQRQGAQQRQVAVTTAGEYLQLRRSYQGLETPTTGAEIKAPMLAAEGLSGRAAGYASEPAAAVAAQPATAGTDSQSTSLQDKGTYQDASW